MRGYHEGTNDVKTRLENIRHRTWKPVASTSVHRDDEGTHNLLAWVARSGALDVHESACAPESINHERPLEVECSMRHANATRSLNGNWKGFQGVTYMISQIEDLVFTRGINSMSMVILEGQGRICGRMVELSFQGIDGSWGTVQLELSSDRNRLSGIATNRENGDTTEVLLTRQGM